MIENSGITSSIRALHASLKDYLLLVGEPSPLLGTLCLRLIETLGSTEFVEIDTIPQSENLDRMSVLVLQAAIMGIMDRLEGLRPISDAHLRSITSCMKIAEALRPSDRRDACFKVLGIALKGLKDLTAGEYPRLIDGEEQELTGEM